MHFSPSLMCELSLETYGVYDHLIPANDAESGWQEYLPKCPGMSTIVSMYILE